MVSAAVTPHMRAQGWNFDFVSGCGKDRFSGLYYPPDSDTLTFRDLARELCLCFQIKGHGFASGDDATEACDHIAFDHVDIAPSRLAEVPTFIYGQNLDRPLSAIRRQLSVNEMAQGIVRLHVVGHADCELSSTEPLAKHLQARCAKHIDYPSLRIDCRYLPPNKVSTDPAFAIFPYRRKVGTSQGSVSSSKRTASGSVSRANDISNPLTDSGGDDDLTSLVTPPASDLTLAASRQAMARFREAGLVGSVVCAVTGKGRSWCACPPMGPALQVCHIVPQQHYHVYPLPGDSGADNRNSPRLLREAWERTWSASNAILLLSHLHEAFDSRLFSIHPDTMRIRVFVPYDVLIEYHDRKAVLPRSVDRKALQHHYEMCCIENMAAERTLSEPILISAADSGSITASPLQFRPGALGVLAPVVAAQLPSSNRGQALKRSRPYDLREACSYIEKAESLCSLPPWSGRFWDGEGWSDRSSRKRCKLADEENAEVLHRYDESQWEGCITPWNASSFLADVNWELQRNLPCK